MGNMINWFEIPAAEIGRAITFYQNILGISIQENEMMGTKMGFFPAEGRAVSGALVQGDDYTPGSEGPLVYLNGGNDLENVLSKISDAGGTVIVPKTQISPEAGYFALFIDTEGNRIGLHSMN